MIKLLSSNGFAKLSSHKDAVRFASMKAKDGHKVTIKQEGDGRYKVSFEPKK